MMGLRTNRENIYGINVSPQYGVFMREISFIPVTASTYKNSSLRRTGVYVPTVATELLTKHEYNISRNSNNCVWI